MKWSAWAAVATIATHGVVTISLAAWVISGPDVDPMPSQELTYFSLILLWWAVPMVATHAFLGARDAGNK
jgi:hypothetical protein